MADIPDLYLSLIKSPQSHFKVCLIKLENCKTPNKERRIIGFPSLNLSVNVSKVLMDCVGLTGTSPESKHANNILIILQSLLLRQIENDEADSGSDRAGGISSGGWAWEYQHS